MYFPGSRKRRFERFLKKFFKRRRQRGWVANYPGLIVKRSRFQRSISKFIQRRRQRGWLADLPDLTAKLTQPSLKLWLIYFVLFASAAGSLVFLLIFKPIPNLFALRSASSSNRPASGTLYQSMPSGYASLRKGPVVGSCETIAFETVKPGQYLINGYGIINESKGETPIWVYVEIIKNGRSYYATAESTKRPDIVQEFKNSLLLYSGFKLLLPPGAVAPPFEAKTYLVFDDTSFPCLYTARVS